MEVSDLWCSSGINAHSLHVL